MTDKGEMRLYSGKGNFFVPPSPHLSPRYLLYQLKKIYIKCKKIYLHTLQNVI